MSVDIYEATKTFPLEERFGLTSQMRRAAVSIASNIAEGAARQGPKEFAQFLSIASGSASELDTQIVICQRLELGKQDIWHSLRTTTNEVSRMLQGLIRSVRAKISH